jgi:hypothetical protein
MDTKFEPSQNFKYFWIKDFQQYDSYKVYDELRLGAKLDLRREPSHPIYPEAVAIYFGETKLGYIPKEYCSEIYKLLHFGYDDFYDAFISSDCSKTSIDSFCWVTVRLKDKRIIMAGRMGGFKNE